MSDYRKIQVWFNDLGEQVDSAGRTLSPGEQLRLIYDETVVICATFLRVAPNDAMPEAARIALDPAASFACFGRPASGGELIFLCEDPLRINAPGDWLDGADANPVDGQLSFRVNTNTIAFAAALGNNDAVEAVMVITATPPGETACGVLALCEFIAKNRPTQNTTPPEEVATEFFSAAQINALFAAGLDMQFAPERGEQDTSAICRESDRFYRMRNSALAHAHWSEWVPMLEGAPAEAVPDLAINTAALVNHIFEADADTIGVKGEPCVQLFRPDNCAATCADAVKIGWHNQILRVDFSSATAVSGVWKVKFGGGMAPARMVHAPAAFPSFYNDEFAFHHRLDHTCPTLVFPDHADELTRIYLKIRADNGSGNVKLAVAVSGVIVAEAVLSAGGIATRQSIRVALPANGALELRRLVDDPADTLAGAAVITNIALEELI